MRNAWCCPRIGQLLIPGTMQHELGQPPAPGKRLVAPEHGARAGGGLEMLEERRFKLLYLDGVTGAMGDDLSGQIVLESRNRGIAESRNRGIAESRNRGIAESRNRDSAGRKAMPRLIFRFLALARSTSSLSSSVLSRIALLAALLLAGGGAAPVFATTEHLSATLTVKNIARYNQGLLQLQQRRPL